MLVMLGLALIVGVYALAVYATRRLDAGPPRNDQLERFLDMLARVRWYLANRNRV
jgi:hypothetical protein